MTRPKQCLAVTRRRKTGPVDTCVFQSPPSSSKKRAPPRPKPCPDKLRRMCLRETLLAELELPNSTASWADFVAYLRRSIRLAELQLLRPSTAAPEPNPEDDHDIEDAEFLREYAKATAADAAVEAAMAAEAAERGEEWSTRRDKDPVAEERRRRPWRHSVVPPRTPRAPIEVPTNQSYRLDDDEIEDRARSIKQYGPSILRNNQGTFDTIRGRLAYTSDDQIRKLAVLFLRAKSLEEVLRTQHRLEMYLRPRPDDPEKRHAIYELVQSMHRQMEAYYFRHLNPPLMEEVWCAAQPSSSSADAPPPPTTARLDPSVDWFRDDHLRAPLFRQIVETVDRYAPDSVAGEWRQMHVLLLGSGLQPLCAALRGLRDRYHKEGRRQMSIHVTVANWPPGDDEAYYIDQLDHGCHGIPVWSGGRADVHNAGEFVPFTTTDVLLANLPRTVEYDVIVDNVESRHDPKYEPVNTFADAATVERLSEHVNRETGLYFVVDWDGMVAFPSNTGLRPRPGDDIDVRYGPNNGVRAYAFQTLRSVNFLHNIEGGVSHALMSHAGGYAAANDTPLTSRVLFIGTEIHLLNQPFGDSLRITAALWPRHLPTPFSEFDKAVHDRPLPKLSVVWHHRDAPLNNVDTLVAFLRESKPAGEDLFDVIFLNMPFRHDPRLEPEDPLQRRDLVNLLIDRLEPKRGAIMVTDWTGRPAAEVKELPEMRQFRDAGLSEPLITDGFFETDPSTAPPGMQTRAVMMIAEKRN